MAGDHRLIEDSDHLETSEFGRRTAVGSPTEDHLRVAGHVDEQFAGFRLRQ